MEEEASSWIRRTKFSHTVCHRLDASRLASIPLTIHQRERITGAKSRPVNASVNPKQEPVVAKLQRNPTTNKQRAVSPLPETKLLDTFREARSAQKRFSTPHPRRQESDKGKVGKYKEAKGQGFKSPGSKSPINGSPLRHFSSMKFHEKPKSRKDSAWSKYFDHAGGRVTSVDAADEHMVDLSKLFLGLRFAHGAHSQLYHGIYKDEPVAVKIIRVPDDDENEDLAARLEKQFNREVTLLSRLHHQNVIKVIDFYSISGLFLGLSLLIKSTCPLFYRPTAVCTGSG